VTFSAHAPARTYRPVLVNGAAGVAVFDRLGEPFSLLAFTVAQGRIVEINILADRERLGPLLNSIREG
jgi:RNA polymerase sigma-70 factor (ECF subfamily)